MPKNTVKRKKLTPDQIARMSERGEDVTRYMKSVKFHPGHKDIQVMPSVQRVNVDFASAMLSELDEISTELNVSRQGLIKTWLRDALDRYYVNKKHRSG